MIQSYIQSKPGGRPYKIENFINILLAVSEKRLCVNDIAAKTCKNGVHTSRMLNILREKGLIKKVFAGHHRFIILTEEGVDVVRHIRECAL